jgi:hypothetical protein
MADTNILNLADPTVAALVALFDEAVLAQPSGSYARLKRHGRTGAYVSQRHEYEWLRLDHLATHPTPAEVKSFGEGNWKGNCIFVWTSNLDAVITFATRMVAEMEPKPAKPVKAPKIVEPEPEPEAEEAPVETAKARKSRLAREKRASAKSSA